MKEYLKPLGIFVGGNLLILVVLLFMPAIGQAGADLAGNTSAMAPTFWGWTWAVGGIKLWVWLALEGVILWRTAKAFLAIRS